MRALTPSFIQSTQLHTHIQSNHRDIISVKSGLGLDSKASSAAKGHTMMAFIAHLDRKHNFISISS